MNVARRYALPLVCLLFGLCTAHGADWPLDRFVVIATFGQARDGEFLKGMDIQGGTQPVLPIDDGEVVFSFEEGERADGIPTGLGSFIVLEHESRLRSIYGHLEEGSVNRTTETLTRTVAVGSLGDSGASEGKRLHLRIEDRELGQVVNPLLILPSKQDTRPPMIRDVAVVLDGSSVPVRNGAIVTPVLTELIAKIYDPQPELPFHSPLAPYRIVVNLNGKQVFQATCDAIKQSGDDLVLTPSDGLSFREFFVDTETIRLGSLPLSTGRARIEIKAYDFAQNERIESFVLNVR